MIFFRCLRKDVHINIREVLKMVSYTRDWMKNIDAQLQKD